jgi:DnaJ-like protein
LIKLIEMSLEKLIEKKIEEAIERGDFDNLPNAGKPLDLEPYFKMREDVRLAYSLLKSNNFVPEEVDVLNEISALKEQISEASDDRERSQLGRLLNERSLALSLMLERYKRRTR